MEFERFAAFSSTNQEELLAVNQEFEEAIQNPEFIEALFSYIEPASSNPTSLKIILFAIKRMILRKWTQDTVFWEFEAQTQIFNHLLQLILQLPVEYRDLIQDCFARMVTDSDYGIIELIPQIVEDLGQRTDLSEIYCELQILQRWAQKCYFQPLTDEQKAQYEASIEELNASIVQAFIPISQAISEDLNQSFALKILRSIAKALSFFSRKSAAMFTDESFDSLLELFIEALKIESQDINVFKLKRTITNLFIQLTNSFLGEIEDDDEEGGEPPEAFDAVPVGATPAAQPKTEQEQVRGQYGVHYRDDILPSLVEAINFIIEHDTDDTLLAQTFYLLSLLLFHSIITTEEVNEEFISNVLLPAARLNQENIRDSVLNPTAYVGWNMQYTTNIITRRRACANIVKALVKKYSLLDELYDLLLAPTVDPIDFEGRIYLMAGFLKFTNSNQGAMIEPDVIDMLAEAMKLDTQPPYIIASILMLMRYALPSMDPELGVRLAFQCILNSDSAIVLIIAAKLLTFCTEDPVEIPDVQEQIPNVLRKLLDCSTEINAPSLRRAVFSTLKLGGEQSLTLLHEVIVQMLAFCDEEPQVNSETGKLVEDTSALIASITSVAAMMNAAKEPVEVFVQTAMEIVLPKITQYFTTHPQTNLYDEILYLLSIIFINLPGPIDAAYTMASQILQIIIQDEALISHTEQISVTFCPLIIKQGDGAEAERTAFNDVCFQACANMLQYCDAHEESTANDRAYALLMAGCLIQTCGDPALVFVQAAKEGIVAADENEAVLFSASVLVLAAAYACNLEETNSKLDPESIEHIATSINTNVLPTYKEFKLGFVLELFLCRAGRKGSYRAAVELLPALANLKAEDELESQLTPAQQQQNLEQLSLILPFDLPIYSIDEFQLFDQLTNETGLYNALAAKQKKTVKKYFQM